VRQALGEAVCGIWTWVEKHLRDVERSRQAYDRRKAAPSPLAEVDRAAGGASSRRSR
jgi:hypothetical protein